MVKYKGISKKQGVGTLKIIIAGVGKVGYTLAQALSEEGHDLVVVDMDSSVLSYAEEQIDLLSVQGNCASMQTLKDADVEKAELLIACTGIDEVNLLCCMTAYQLNHNIHTIARIRDPEYDEQAYVMRDAFGLSMTFNPEKQAAEEIERLLKYPGFLTRDSFAKGKVQIAELRIDEESKLCNAKLRDISTIVKCQVLICAVLRDGRAITPDGRFVLKDGDRVFVTAPADQLAILLKSLRIVTHRVHNVLLAGGGTISYYIAQILKDSRIRVHIVDHDRERCERLAAQLPKTNVVCGDLVNQRFLESDGFASYDAMVSLTGSDELNIVLSLFGDQCRIPQIITKISHLDNAKFTDSLPLGSIICPRKLCCDTIVRYVRAMQNQTGAALSIHSLADGQAEAMEFAVDSETLFCDVPLKRVKLKKNILLVAISHGRQVEIPNGESRFSIGDRVVIVNSGDSVIVQLNDIFA